MEPPLVSICCITYNHENFIKQCLDGFLLQKTDFQFEIIIHDDASTDGTDGIIKEYQEKYPNIIIPIFQSENQYAKGLRGMYAAFVYPKARGKYIALCEGDDYWTREDKLQRQIDFLEENPSYSSCFTNAEVIDDTKGFVKNYFNFDHNKTYGASDIIKKGGGLFPTASMVFRNSLPPYPDFLKKANSGDRPLGLLLLSLGDFYLLNQITCVYRRHDGGVYTSIRENKKLKGDFKLHNIELLRSFNAYSDFKYNKIIKGLISGIRRDLMLKKHPSAFSIAAIKDVSIRDWCSYFYHSFFKD